MRKKKKIEEEEDRNYRAKYDGPLLHRAAIKRQRSDRNVHLNVKHDITSKTGMVRTTVW